MIDLSPLIQTDAGQLISLAGRLSGYSHSITAIGGFESATLQYVCSATEAQQALALPGSELIVVTGQGNTAWQGQIVGVEVTLGQDQRSVSLEQMVNAVRVRYSAIDGTTNLITPWAIDEDSIAQYGRKEAILSPSARTDTAHAIAYGAAYLRERAQPHPTVATTLATGDGGGVSVRLLAAGWYYCLDWLLVNIVDKTLQTTAVQIAALLGAGAGGYQAVNNVFGDVEITTDGPATPRLTEQDATYRSKIETLLSYGTTTGQRMVAGVYEDRTFRLSEAAGNVDTPIAYRRYASSNVLINTGGMQIQPWDVRPDALCALIDLDAGSNTEFYVERVTLDVGTSGVSLQLEPTTTTALDAQLALLNAGIR